VAIQTLSSFAVGSTAINSSCRSRYTVVIAGGGLGGVGSHTGLVLESERLTAADILEGERAGHSALLSQERPVRPSSFRRRPGGS
jgi:hypothetical protein